MAEAKKIALNEVAQYAQNHFNTIQYSVESP